MNVVYSSSDSYSLVAGISMYSLLCSNKDCDELNIFLIDNNITDVNKAKFQKMCEQFGRKLFLVPIADIEQMAGASINIGKWNISTFAKLFYASFLPKWVEKVIHIDCDTMVTSSIEGLWNIDMEDAVVAGCLDCVGDNYKTEIDMKRDYLYINAGVVMLNLKRIREKGLEEAFKKFLREHRVLSYVDQPVLNSCVQNEEKIVVPLKYNAYSLIFYLKYKNLFKAKRISHYYSKEEVDDAVKNPCIVHFTGCFMDGSRPWIENNLHPLRDKYLSYKAGSEWADQPLWKDPRSGWKKIIHKMFRIFPQGYVAWLSGIVHDLVIPNLHKFMK